MYRDRLEEIRKEKNISHKEWAQKSGVSVDTINRITHSKNHENDSTTVHSLEQLCKVLGVELWELFYTGDKSLVVLQSEIHALNAERDALLEENGALKKEVETLRSRVDSLTDVIIDYFKKQTKD